MKVTAFILERPITKLSELLKRHWVIVLIVLFLLLLAPPIMQSMAVLYYALAKLVEKIGDLLKIPKDTIDSIKNTLGKITIRLQNFWEGVKADGSPSRLNKWFAIIPLLILLPELGAILLVWTLLDKLKKPRVQINPSPSTEEKSSGASMLDTSGFSLAERIPAQNDESLVPPWLGQGQEAKPEPPRLWWQSSDIWPFLPEDFASAYYRTEFAYWPTPSGALDFQEIVPNFNISPAITKTT